MSSPYADVQASSICANVYFFIFSFLLSHLNMMANELQELNSAALETGESRPASFCLKLKPQRGVERAPETQVTRLNHSQVMTKDAALKRGYLDAR